jgi:exosortase
MNDTASIQPPTMTESRAGTLFPTRWVLPMLGLAAGWILVFNVLRADWATNAQYYYGWFVPLLAVGLFRLRWTWRPLAAPADSGRAEALTGGLALALVLPIRLIEEANPEWRLIQWTHAFEMVFITFCLLYYAGGRAWARHFAFPICFLLVAVPWPVPLEQGFVQYLMREIAGATVELVGLFDIPAVQHGNLIQIKAGVVGIDEACSGVRSLQTALFICLFLGELHRFSWRRRMTLILLGFLVALLANLGRTFYLVWSAFHHGMDRMHAVHDTAGQLVMIGTLIGIWIVSQGLRYRLKENLPVGSQSVATATRNIPTLFAVGALAWLLLAQLLTEGWYRIHESKTQFNARWAVSWPQSPNQAQLIKIDDSATAILRYNEGRQAKWQDEAGNLWQVFFFRWEPGRNSARLASAHTPDVCMRGLGCRLIRDLGIQQLAVKGLVLPFRQYVFERSGTQLNVFYCRWEDEVSAEIDNSHYDIGRLSRFRAVFAGRRHLGQQVLEAIVTGPETPAEGLAAFEAQIPQLIRR